MNTHRLCTRRHSSIVTQVLIAAILVATSSVASADVCEKVNNATAAITGAAAAGATTLAAMAASPLTPVAHSSGALILTSTSGYVANTLGFVASAWAVATAPVTLIVGGAIVATGTGIVVTCHYLGD